MEVQLVRRSGLLRPAPRGHLDPQAHPLAPIARRHLEHRHRAQGRPDLGLHPHGASGHRDRPQGRRGRQDPQGRRARDEEAGRREGRGHELGRLRDAPRDRRDAARAGRGRAARRPRVVPPRDAPGGADRDALGRARRAGAVRRPPGRRRDVPPRVVPRGPGPAAHAPREDRLRDGRGQDHVRADRREGLGLPRRRDPAGRAGDRAAPRSRARAGLQRRRLDRRAHHRRARGRRGRRARGTGRVGGEADAASGGGAGGGADRRLVGAGGRAEHGRRRRRRAGGACRRGRTADAGEAQA